LYLKEGDCLSVIAQDVFKLAMDLMDEVSEDGSFGGYPEEYRKRAWSFITMLQTELLRADVEPIAITNELNVLLIDDRTAITVIPYGLAAHLLMSEDQNRAAFFNARYDELKRKLPTKIESIIDVYGLFPNSNNDEGITYEGDYNGGTFLDPNSGVYDGGDF
jgi:hypothetical protein